MSLPCTVDTVVVPRMSVEPISRGWNYDPFTPFFEELGHGSTPPDIEHFSSFAARFNIKEYKKDLRVFEKCDSLSEYLAYLQDTRMALRLSMRNDCWLYVRCDGRWPLDEKLAYWKFWLFTSFGYTWYGYAHNHTTDINKQAVNLMHYSLDSYCEEEKEYENTV